MLPLPGPHPLPQTPAASSLVSELLPTDASSELTNDTAETESRDIGDDVADDVKQEESVGVVHQVTKEWTSKGEWQCPPFSYRQEENGVFFVLQTTGVKKPSMASHFDEHQVSVCHSVCT